MPLDTSIKSVLIIGSGPFVIGQACEFDYSGSQALRSLREDGIETILINSNPATIMTDPVMADPIRFQCDSRGVKEIAVACGKSVMKNPDRHDDTGLIIDVLDREMIVGT